MRFLYASLIRLHPPSFRTRFADEMRLTFEEAAHSWGPSALLGDALQPGALSSKLFHQRPPVFVLLDRTLLSH